MKKALLIILNLTLLCLYPISYYNAERKAYEAQWSQPMSDAEVKIAYANWRAGNSG